MNTPQGTILIVDDDPGMRKALTRLCASAGLRAKAFASAREFLDASPADRPACLLLDVSMPGLNGLDLQLELAARNIPTPIVFMTGCGDIPMSVRAMKAGAVDFLTKPFNDRDLLAVIHQALAKDVLSHAQQTAQQTIRHRLETLTPRERQVFERVIRGLLNKQIAAELGASEQTIKVHRGRVMEKMQVCSVADLVQAAVKIGLLPS